MSTEEKVDLVALVKDNYSLASVLAAVELPKSTWYYHRNQKDTYHKKYAHLQPLLEEVARKHPSYGIPRIVKELRETYHQKVNHKVIQRLLKQWDLSLVRNVHKPKPSGIKKAIMTAGKRANLVSQMEQVGIFMVIYTDFTELLYADGTRKAHFMPMIGHTSKMVFGWQVGQRANTALALSAWRRAKSTLKNLAIPYKGIIVHHDQDSVFTGYAWCNQLMIKDEVRLSYAINGAKDNPEMESFNGRFKNENRSLILDAQTFEELEDILTKQIDYYNKVRRHSSLDYISPQEFILNQHTVTR